MNNIKIVAVGDGAVGKTCLLYSYAHNIFPTDYIPTVFDNYRLNTFFEDSPYTVDLWDTAGQEDFDKMRPLSYPKTDVFLVCYSVISLTSFSNVKYKWRYELKELANNVPKILVGLKNDLRDDKQFINCVNKSEADEFAKTNGFDAHCLCSALTKEGTSEVLNVAISSAIEHKNKKEIKKSRCIIS